MIEQLESVFGREYAKSWWKLEEIHKNLPRDVDAWAKEHPKDWSWLYPSKMEKKIVQERTMSLRARGTYDIITSRVN